MSMSTLRRWSLALGVASALSLQACGGGGGSGGSTGAATLSGSVLLVDGSTANLGGIRLFNPGSGRTVTTRPDGTFAFGEVPAGTIAIRLVGLPSARLAETEGEDEGDAEDGEGDGDGEGDDEGSEDEGDDENDATDDDDDDDGDGDDVGDDDCDVKDVADGEDVEIRITIKDGVIETIEVGRSEDGENGEGDERECEGRMERAEASDDADIEGRVRAETREDGDRLKISVEHATEGRALVAIVLDGDEEASLGSRTVDGEGEAMWVIETPGGTLPFGVTSVAELVGLRVEIRDAGDARVLLIGEVNELPGSAGDDDSVDQEGREGIPRVGAPVGSEAHVKIEHRTGLEPREKIEVEVEGLESGAIVNVWLEVPEVPGTFSMVGTLTINGEHEGEWELSTADGDTLPFGVESVSSLVGLRIELRNPANAVLFSGEVPALATN